jgi:hypothetical protein
MSSYFKLLKSVRNDVVVPTFHEFMRSLPDSLLFGSSIFGLITQSFPVGIFVLAMMELALTQRLIGGFFQATGGDNLHAASDICMSGLPSPYQISLVGTILQETTFPSGAVFFVSGVIAYTLASSFNFTKELEELGKKEPEWKARIPLGVVFSFLFMLLFSFWRYANGCESAPVILGSVFFGLLVGGLIYLLHVYLFGRDAINFLGVPLLASRAALGRPLYACAKQEVQKTS